MRCSNLIAIAIAATAALAAGCTRSSHAGPADATRLTPFQAAERVIGQPDFASVAPDGGGAAPSASGVRFPVGDAQLAGGALVLPDTYNHRLLSFHGLPGADGAAADAILGQDEPTAVAPGHEPGRYHFPRSVGAADTGLLVADGGANRVQLRVGGPGVVSLGWGAAQVHRTGCAADRLAEPWRAIVADGKLVVVDRGNNRVLVWNQAPVADAPADLVIGQQDLTHCAANDALGAGRSGGRSATTLRLPTDAWSDGKRLVVVDQGNNRVLLWNAFPTASGAPADLVLGQADFNVAAGETTRTGLRAPGFVASDGTALFVADVRNHRVLGWARFPSASGAPADVVLGQGDFVHGAPNDDLQDGSAHPSARTLNLPMGLALAGDHLVVTDTANHRFLLFRRR